MRRAASQPLLRHFQEGGDDDEEEELEEELRVRTKGKALRNINSTANQMSCMSHHKRQPKKTCDQFFTCEKYWTWKQGQRAGAARLKKQLKSRLTIQKLIDDQMTRFKARYNQAMVPMRMADVSQILMPKWIPAHELAAAFWLGDWRPSTMLELLCSLSHSSWDPIGVSSTMAQLINDVQIEEAVINEEMIEIQSNCVLNLPFSPVKNRGVGPPLNQVRSEFKKIHRVILKDESACIGREEGAVPVGCSRVPNHIHGYSGCYPRICHEMEGMQCPVCIKEPGVLTPVGEGSCKSVNGC